MHCLSLLQGHAGSRQLGLEGAVRQRRLGLAAAAQELAATVQGQRSACRGMTRAWHTRSHASTYMKTRGTERAPVMSFM